MYRSDVLVRTWRLNTKELSKLPYLLAPIETEYAVAGTFYLSSSMIITHSSFMSMMNNMTRFYPIRFPRDRVISIPESEIYEWLRCEHRVSIYLLESISMHRTLDLGELWKLHQSKLIDVCNVIRFTDITINTLYKLTSVTSDPQEVKFLRKALKSTKTDKQIRKILFSYTCNPKILYLRARYYKWCEYYKSN